MSNNNNNQTTLNNLKALRSSGKKNVEDVIASVGVAKQKLDELIKAITLKEKDYLEPSLPNEMAVEAVVATNEKEVVNTVVEQEKAPTVDVKVDAQVSTPTQVSAPTPVVEQAPKKQSQQVVAKIDAAKPAATKPTGEVVDGKRTYVDAKGNVTVRKFISEVLPNKPVPRPSNHLGTINLNLNTNNRGGYNNNNATSRPPYNNNSTSRPPYNANRPNNFGNNTQSRPNGAPYQPRPYSPRPQQGGAGMYNKDAVADTTKHFSSAKNAKKPNAFGGIEGIAPPNQHVKSFGNKNKTPEKTDEKRFNKKVFIQNEYGNDGDDDRLIARRARPRKETKPVEVVKKAAIEKAVVTTKNVSIKVLSEKIGKAVPEIIKQLFKEGIVKTANDSIDYEYAAYISSMFNITLELKEEMSFEEKMVVNEAVDGDDSDMIKRPPVVTVMGHVDHGKTSILDVIRRASVASGEAGGITQHIGAYTVKANGEDITFIDTPGHEAFTAMRARGAMATDIAILVVAADDGVMPQTIEAINHAKAANVPIIVAINKMDKPEADPERVKQQLTEYGVLPEDWGGDAVIVPVSAKANMGIDKLLEAVLLVAEVNNYRANPNKRATGTVIEAQLDKGRGPVATVLISNGTLFVGDNIVAGTAVGKVRALFDDKGRQVKQALPSCPVEVLGFDNVPNAGDYMYAVDERLAKQVADERKNKEKTDRIATSATVTLDDLFGKISEGQLKTLNIIIKADVQGSQEALKLSLSKISNEEVKVNPIHGGVGAITETDVMLAKASNAIIIAFNVRPDANAKIVAEREGVDIRQYRIIYDAVNDITDAMKGMLTPKFKETIIGQAEVRNVFKITGVGIVAGCYVTSGKVSRNAKVRLYRDNVIVFDGAISGLKHLKDDVKDVATGYECGISLSNYSDIKEKDIIEAYLVEQLAR